MSLYNMLFGMNPDADRLLDLLGKTKEDFGRFRNVSVEGKQIAVYTRCGGGNRDDYGHVFAEMSEHPWFTHDADDDFDSTYATFYFELPSEKYEAWSKLLDKGSNPKEQWEVFQAIMKDK